MLRLIGFIILLSGFIWKAHAIDNVQLSFDAVETDLFQAADVKVELNWLDSTTLSISISAESVTSGRLESVSSVTISCPATGYVNQRFYCADGMASFHDENDEEKSMKLGFSFAAGQDWQFRLDNIDLDLSLFGGLLQYLHPELQNYQLTEGHIRGQIEITGNNDLVNKVVFKGRLDDLFLNGDSILEDTGLNLDLHLTREPGAWFAAMDLSITTGSMYVIPGIDVLGDKPGFFIEVGEQPVSMGLIGRWNMDMGTLNLEHFSYYHPGMMTLEGDAEIQFADTINLTALNLRVNIEKLGTTFPVYIQPLLLQTNFSELEIAGGLALEMNYRDQGLERLDLSFNGIYMDDHNDRFSLSNLAGNLSLRSDPEPVRSSLNWEGMSFHRLEFGAGAVVFESEAGQIEVLNWEDVDVLDGKLEISSLNMKNVGAPDFELTMDANLTPISMQAFTQAMQWPLMSGTLAGAFQGLEYGNKNLRLNGDIDIQLFDGSVVLKNLLIRNIFGEYSRLSANMEVIGLDLERLTDTFTFGKIEGTLNGSINGLVLENWQPVYFEAAFETPEADEKPHRISQKALDNLNSLGGGLSGTMSRGLTRFFQEYSYGQIGLSCRLNNGVCELGGVMDTGDGFYLLTSGGLLPPWVEVKGAGRSIRWSHLVDGLKQIIQGEAVIE